MLKVKNRYDRLEWAGAFGDLGTLIPFVAGYIAVVKFDPLGVLFTLGLVLIGCGLFYKTPIPVQPMKAIGGAAITSAAITPNMVWGAGIFTGLFWLVLGLSGKLHLIAKFVTKPLQRGIVLGLGLSLFVEGTKMMQSNFLIALIALIITFVLLNNKRFPAMFALLIFGIIVGMITNPGLLKEIAGIHFDFRLPSFALSHLTWNDFLMGTLILGIPQIPLTFANAVLAITSENNRLFPERPVTENKVAISQGLMNLISPLLGGMPMCHGAGGMAGHVRFGARTGGALVILGGILLIVGLCFSTSVLAILDLFPKSVLGVILLFAGLELAVAAHDVGTEKNDFYILLITAGFSLWNMGIGFLAGLVLQELLKRKILKL